MIFIFLMKRYVKPNVVHLSIVLYPNISIVYSKIQVFGLYSENPNGLEIVLRFGG